jgi:hypothetical protein
LCQEDTYLLELVRYIHLNPLRAKIVKSLKESDKYLYSGHNALMGRIQREFQDTKYERLEERYRLQAQGYDLTKVTIRVSSELGIKPEQVWKAGKHPLTVKARSLLCYWAVRKLGFSATELSKKLGVSQPSVSISVARGEKIAKTGQLELEEN